MGWLFGDVRRPGKQLRKRFQTLGNMAGKTEREVAEAVGRGPNSISQMHGGRLLQWQAPGYHVAILFGEDHVFQKITHESVS